MVQLIVIANGIELRDFQGQAVQRFLQANCDRKGATPAPGANNTWLFPKGSTSRATHEIRVTYDLADLAAALDIDNALVVYEGHSRYGQGPAFGPENTPHVPDQKAFPVNPWGVHFRMGYDATDTKCIADLLEHSVVPAEFDLTAAHPKAFLPHDLIDAARKAGAQQRAIKARKRKPAAVCGLDGAWREMSVCEPTLATATTARGDQPLAGRHYYQHLRGKQVKQEEFITAYQHLPGKPEEFMTAVTVGSADLDTVTLKCSVFFMASCSSKVHYYEPLARRRKAAKSACKFLLTNEIPRAYHAATFLELVLLKKLDPRTQRGLRHVARALNGQHQSGRVWIY